MQAQLHVSKHFQIGEVSPLIFGGFLEHMGRSVYEGVYDPDSPLADSRGLRTDVLAALVELELTTVRYPGVTSPPAITGKMVSDHERKDRPSVISPGTALKPINLVPTSLSSCVAN